MLETRLYAPPYEAGEEVGNSNFGKRLDMRIATFCGDEVAPFWVESWQFVPWTASIEESAS